MLPSQPLKKYLTLEANPSMLVKEIPLLNLERVIIEHKLEENVTICDKCLSKLIVIETKKKTLKYKPAELYIEKHIIYSYACKSCEETEKSQYNFS